MNKTELQRQISAYSQGSAVRAWEFMGSHAAIQDGQDGYVFRVWAPKARGVSIVGDFNEWNQEANPMNWVDGGVWEGFIPGLSRYENYQYAVRTQEDNWLFKADPYAFHAETRPAKASKIYELAGYEWQDSGWLSHRKTHPIYNQPVNIYELHLGSWRRTGEGELLSYRDIAYYLVPYVKEMGFTHVELMPVMEYPFDDSWGYQCTGYFAATSRYGTPDDLKYLIDELHKAGVGVILDWVPAHFPKDGFGLYRFDGSACYEYADPRIGEHHEWGTMVFDYSKPEVRSFLYSSAMFWLEEYHADGLRVDAVASMLYRDYDRKAGEWIPNKKGGKENLEAVEFLQTLNERVFLDHPDVMMVAEESTSWPLVTRPTSDGGLGFNLKWNMGWMNDISHYIKLDPYFRQFNHKDITFSFMYAFSENFLLPISHDEVVHMKSSLIGKMPGTDEEKFAGVRAMYTYMMTHPGKKLLFMGGEFGQWNEWNFEQSLDWHLLEQERHQQLQNFFKAIGAFYLEHSELWELDFSWEGFEWIEADDNKGNTAIFVRKNEKGKQLVIAINFSNFHRQGYRVGLPVAGTYECVFNSDAVEFGGTGAGDTQPLKTSEIPCHGRAYSIDIDLPPMSGVVYACTRKKPAPKKKPVEAKEAKAAQKPESATAKKKSGRTKAERITVGVTESKAKKADKSIKKVEKAEKPVIKGRPAKPVVKEPAAKPAVRAAEARPTEKPETKASKTEAKPAEKPEPKAAKAEAKPAEKPETKATKAEAKPAEKPETKAAKAAAKPTEKPETKVAKEEKKPTEQAEATTVKAEASPAAQAETKTKKATKTGK